MCDIEAAGYVTFIGPRRSVRRIVESWQDIMVSCGLSISPPTPISLEHLGPEFGDESPEVAISFHPKFSPHVAHRLQAHLLTAVDAPQVVVEQGYRLRGVGAPGGGSALVRLDTANWPGQAVLTQVTLARGGKVATLDTGDCGTSREMTVFTDTKPYTAPPGDPHGHGTAVGEIIRQQAMSADVYPLQVLDSNNECWSYQVLSALIYALWKDNGFDLVNASLTTQLTSSCSTSVGAGLDHVRALCAAKRCPLPVIVAAAGNDPAKPIAYPALLRDAVVVMATDDAGQRAPYNSTLPAGSPVAVAEAFGGTDGKPVGAITCPGGTDKPLFGTSFAAAFVTAAHIPQQPA